MQKSSILEHFLLEPENNSTFISGIDSYGSIDPFFVYSPIDDTILGSVCTTQHYEYQKAIETSKEAYLKWSNVTAPKRGEIVRQIGNELRLEKEHLAQLLTLEMGKTYQESLGEVQEMIDICDFAVGLSRQLYGLTMHSERPNHRMYEQYHSLGIVGIISAFNFPVAVWAWNAMLAFTCGNTCVWKPSEKTPLVALAVFKIVSRVLDKNKAPSGLFIIINGGKAVGEFISLDKNIALVSATGSTQMGRDVATKVSQRFGKTLLELGGNNALIITQNANLELAKRAVVFGAVGTAGQRCTTTRRLIVHESVYDVFKADLLKSYAQLVVGNPFDSSSHVGPLIDSMAVQKYSACLESFDKKSVIFGNEVLNSIGNCYVKPSIVETDFSNLMVQKETFAPILYLIKYSGGIKNAISIQNSVNQGLSSSIFTDNVQEMELFLSSQGSDCGIANVNIGTSGAEIGGAFGGEKETGGGRESGSDAWKNYMRRQTNTINYGTELPLSQGIKFEI